MEINKVVIAYLEAGLKDKFTKVTFILYSLIHTDNLCYTKKLSLNLNSLDQYEMLKNERCFKL